MLNIVNTINAYLSNYILVFLLVAVGLWYTIKTKFVQVKYLGTGLKQIFGVLSFKGGSHGGGMSSFQAVATAIAAQVGTGNIVGSAGAILTGGPVYYITHAFKGRLGKFLAGFFAIALIIALGLIGCMVQSNSIVSTINIAFGIPSWIVGVVLVIICAFIFMGGVDRLASVTEKLVPVMAAVFLLGAAFVAVCLFFFAFSTILGWNLFAKVNIQWLFGEKAVKPFMLVALVFIFLGTIGGNDLVWALSDLFNNLMVLPNAIALFALTGLVTKVLADHNK